MKIYKNNYNQEYVCDLWQIRMVWAYQENKNEEDYSEIWRFHEMKGQEKKTCKVGVRTWKCMDWTMKATRDV